MFALTNATLINLCQNVNILKKCYIKTMEEVEVKFLSINPEQLEARLQKLGAQKIFDKIYRRRVFDFPDLRLDKAGAWVRLRDEGDKVTLVFKQRLGVMSDDGNTNDQSMNEIEIIVADYNQTGLFLENIGLKEKFYEENRRIRYILDDLEFDLDFWPMLEPYLEIEAPSWERISQAIALLELNPQDQKIFSTQQIYALKGINENDYQVISFAGCQKK